MLADSVPLAIPADSQSLNETLGSGPEAAHIDWRLFRVKYGNSVEISSGTELQIPAHLWPGDIHTYTLAAISMIALGLHGPPSLELS